MTLILSRLERGRPIIDEKGCPTLYLLAHLDTVYQQIEGAVNGVAEAVEAIQAAQEAADAANEAAATAQAAADTAQTAATQANTLIEDIEAGELDLSAVKVGGVKFINNGGVLEPDA